MEKRERKHKLIFSTPLAKFLIINGFIVRDLKKKKEDASTLFLFDNTPELIECMQEWVRRGN